MTLKEISPINSLSLKNGHFGSCIARAGNKKSKKLCAREVILNGRVPIFAPL